MKLYGSLYFNAGAYRNFNVLSVRFEFRPENSKRVHSLVRELAYEAGIPSFPRLNRLFFKGDKDKLQNLLRMKASSFVTFTDSSDDVKEEPLDPTNPTHVEIARSLTYLALSFTYREKLIPMWKVEEVFQKRVVSFFVRGYENIPLDQEKELYAARVIRPLLEIRRDGCGLLWVSIFTIPFKVEGDARKRLSHKELRRLSREGYKMYRELARPTPMKRKELQRTLLSEIFGDEATITVKLGEEMLPFKRVTLH